LICWSSQLLVTQIKEILVLSFDFSSLLLFKKGLKSFNDIFGQIAHVLSEVVEQPRDGRRFVFKLAMPIVCSVYYKLIEG